MFQTWCKLNYTTPTMAAQVIALPLWHNDLIQIDKKNVVYRNWKQAGINNILHIIDSNGNIRSKQNLENKYGINIKLMEYNSLMHSIPNSWKQMLNNKTSLILGTEIKNNCSVKINNKNLDLKEVCTKDIYKYIVDKYRAKSPTSKSR